MLPEDPILYLAILFALESKSTKVNLGIGSYKEAHGKPVVLDCVREAERLLLEKDLNKEYLPIEGDKDFIGHIAKLVFGPQAETLSGKLFGAQTIGGTGALRIGAELIARNRKANIYTSDPTWPNHRPIFTYAGLPSSSYPYYSKPLRQLDFPAMCTAIKKMEPGSIILLQACCHNPTGIDPTNEQWRELSALIQKQKLLPFFDVPYQGFGENPNADLFSLRHFAEQGHEMLVAYSCSKNFGLYGERVGALLILGNEEDSLKRASSQAKQIIRGAYSMPPLHGARIVTTILESETLSSLWRKELEQMRRRLCEMRTALADGLKQANPDINVSFLKEQQGLFSLLDIEPAQVQQLRQQYGIYMAANSRINIAGLNPENIDYVVSAIAPLMK